MVRTRASARLASDASSESRGEDDDTTYKSLEKLEKLEKKLRSKKPKSKRTPSNPVQPVEVSIDVPSTSMTLPNIAPRVPMIGPYNSMSNLQQTMGSYQYQYSQRLLQQHRPIGQMTNPYSMMQMWDTRKSPLNYPVHPDVRFKRLPFYDLVTELVKPSTLFNDSRSQDFTFNLTPQEILSFGNEPDVVSAQMRFCLMETSCEQDDCFPPNLNVKVNGKICQLPMPIPTNKGIIEPKRPPGPVNITSLTILNPARSNVVSVQWKNDFGRQYVFSVSLVRKLTSMQLLTRLKNKGTKHSDFTRSLIKEKLREDLDCEIATTSLRVSLVCPLGKMRMVCPCRPSTCLHLQCFDASLFLQMNERKCTWICPVCDKPALYDNLVVDGYFQDVLNSPRLDKQCTEIQLHKDGSWSVHHKEVIQEAVLNDSNVNVEIINDDPDIIPLSDASDSSNGLPCIKRPASVAFGNSQEMGTNEVVDLISDDSDDDIPLKRKTPNPPDEPESISIEVPCDPNYMASEPPRDFNDLHFNKKQKRGVSPDSLEMSSEKKQDRNQKIKQSKIDNFFQPSAKQSATTEPECSERGLFGNVGQNSSVITIDSPSPPEAPSSPMEDTTPPQAIVAPFHPEPDPEPDPLPVEPIADLVNELAEVFPLEVQDILSFE